MKKIKYALIGCGRIAPNHIIAACKNGLEIMGVCDIIRSRADDILKHIPNDYRKRVKVYTDYKTMLKECKPALVAIATESGNHYEIGMACIEAESHLIIEKPIALNLEHADNLIRKAREKNVRLCACHQNRFNKSIQKAHEALENGMFGKLFYGTAHVRWNRNQDYYDQAKWRGTWAQDGGALMNQCIHNIDLLRWMMGDEVTEVFAYTDNLNHDYIEAEDLGLAVVKFSNGAYGVIEGTTNIYPSNLEETLYIFGSSGTIKIGGKSVNKIDEWKFDSCKEEPEVIKAKYIEEPPNVYGFGHNPLYEDVISSIMTGKEPYVNGIAGRNALELVLAIYKSAKTGQKVSLPMRDGSTLAFSK